MISKLQNSGEGSYLKKGNLAVGLVLTVLLFSGIGFVIDILPDRELRLGSSMWVEDYLSIPLGHLKPGVVIRGHYLVGTAGVNLFITNEGNYSRWLDGLSCYTYSLGWRFNFTIPYEDEWYAVFDSDSMLLIHEYKIYISPGFLTMIFTISGIIVALIIGIAFTVRGRLGPTFEPTTRPIYREEITPKEVEPRKPEFICPDCGHANPRDADFCIRCGQDLDLTDEVSR